MKFGKCFFKFQLKEKKNKLKAKLENLKELNFNLQQQLINAPQTIFQHDDFRKAKINKDELKALKEHITPKLSEDGVGFFK